MGYRLICSHRDCDEPAIHPIRDDRRRLVLAYCSEHYRRLVTGAGDTVVQSLRKAGPEPSPKPETWRDRPPLL